MATGACQPRFRINSLGRSGGRSNGWNRRLEPGGARQAAGVDCATKPLARDRWGFAGLPGLREGRALQRMLITIGFGRRGATLVIAVEGNRVKIL